MAPTNPPGRRDIARRGEPVRFTDERRLQLAGRPYGVGAAASRQTSMVARQQGERSDVSTDPAGDAAKVCRGCPMIFEERMVEAEYRIVDATSWSLVRSEQLGTKEKVWLEDHDKRAWLFKQVRADDSGVRGEDWAEKLAGEVAIVLQLPAARVELATRPFTQGLPRGVVSRYMLAEDHSLTHGNELLATRVSGYPLSRTGEVPGYTVAACLEALTGFEATPGAVVPDGAAAAFLFAGYLVLDALIANTDRHHENWAVVQAPGVRPYLAPTFDHGSSLGFQEPEDRKQRLLDSGGLERWVLRAKTKFEDKPSPVDVAAEALAALPRAQVLEWRRRVASFDLGWWRTTLERVPVERMSQADRTFAYNIVRLNMEALLDVY